jgi:hypothetical protein
MGTNITDKKKVERVAGTKNGTEYGDGIRLPWARLLQELKF